jgi:hypothetical protein
MDKELVEKNLNYQNEIKSIAKYIFRLFYFNEDEQLSLALNNEEYQEYGIEKLLDVSEKILGHFESAEEAKKTFKFLNSVAPMYGKEIVESL